LLDEELARAVRSESAAAIMHWWGVTAGVVWRWRKALGVSCTNNPESHRLRKAAAKEGGQAIKARGFTEEECGDRSRRAIAANQGRFLWHGYHGPCWTRAQLRLLGTLPDDMIAQKIGRTVNAVRVMRTRQGIPTALDRRHSGVGPRR
jgi:hypothetical protein